MALANATYYYTPPHTQLKKSAILQMCPARHDQGPKSLFDTGPPTNTGLTPTSPRIILFLDGSEGFADLDILKQGVRPLAQKLGRKLRSKQYSPKITTVIYHDDYFIVNDYESAENFKIRNFSKLYNPQGQPNLLDALGCVLTAYGHENHNIVTIFSGEDKQVNRNIFSSNMQVKKLAKKMFFKNKWSFDAFIIGKDKSMAKSLGLSGKRIKVFSKNDINSAFTKAADKVIENLKDASEFHAQQNRALMIAKTGWSDQPKPSGYGDY